MVTSAHERNFGQCECAGKQRGKGGTWGHSVRSRSEPGDEFEQPQMWNWKD